MKIATIQSALFWEDTNTNLNHFNHFFASLISPVDIIVLPEMFTTGFSMDACKIATTENDSGLKWMLEKAIEKNACIVGSIAIKENNTYYNRLYWVMPNGTIHSYNKRHLFRMAKEQNSYSAGNEKIIIEYKGWRFCPFICYDLRFPVWSRNVQLNQSNQIEPLYDCSIYVANWPSIRSDAWQTLLKARAIENLCYVVGVNRVGVDGNGVEYDGKSSVFDFKGNQLDNHINSSESISIVTLDMNELLEFRKNFPAYLDADNFVLS
jgi:predicted amidohydrolase